MTTVTDIVRWLHQDGLTRLAGVAGRFPQAIAAYTIAVADGTITAHPAVGVGLGSEPITLAADDLPYPAGTPGRLVVVGATSEDDVLVLDLAVAVNFAINSADPEAPARSWAMQLLLNPTIVLTTTNGESLAAGASPRFRYNFIPDGRAASIAIEGGRGPVSTVSLNPETDAPDHLDVDADHTGKLYLGARFWQLRQILSIDETTWSTLSAALDAQSAEQAPVVETLIEPDVPEPTKEEPMTDAYPEMDDFDPDAEEQDPSGPDWQNLTYEVFNPDHTVGVACNRNGEIIGMHLTDEAQENGDTWLAAEILRVAKLAHQKSRVGLRAEMESRGTRSYTIDAFDLPTEAQYAAMENDEFGKTTA